MEGRQLPLGASNYTGEINQTFCEKKLYAQYQNKFWLIAFNKRDTFHFHKQSKVVLTAVLLNLMLTLKSNHNKNMT